MRLHRVGWSLSAVCMLALSPGLARAQEVLRERCFNPNYNCYWRDDLGDQIRRAQQRAADLADRARERSYRLAEAQRERNYRLAEAQRERDDRRLSDRVRVDVLAR